MKTKFTTLEQKSEIVAETVFTHLIDRNINISEKPIFQPRSFENVLHLGCDINYKDVFKCWDSNPNKFTIYFGTKGDEFNQ